VKKVPERGLQPLRRALDGALVNPAKERFRESLIYAMKRGDGKRGTEIGYNRERKGLKN